MCGSLRRLAARVTVAGQQAEPGGALVLVGALEQQLHAEADAEHRHAARRRARASDLVEAERAQAAHRLRERADAGHDDAVGRADLVVVGGDARASAPTCSSAFSTLRRLPIP